LEGIRDCFIKHYVEKAENASNMAVDERNPVSGGTGERVTEIFGMKYSGFGVTGEHGMKHL
jgi:hypothetical protein